MFGGVLIRLLETQQDLLIDAEELPDVVQVIVVDILELRVVEDHQQILVMDHLARPEQILLHVDSVLVHLFDERVDVFDLVQDFLYLHHYFLHHGEATVVVLRDELVNGLDLLVVLPELLELIDDNDFLLLSLGETQLVDDVDRPLLELVEVRIKAVAFLVLAPHEDVLLQDFVLLHRKQHLVEHLVPNDIILLKELEDFADLLISQLLPLVLLLDDLVDDIDVLHGLLVELPELLELEAVEIDVDFERLRVDDEVPEEVFVLVLCFVVVLYFQEEVFEVFLLQDQLVVQVLFKV